MNTTPCRLGRVEHDGFRYCHEHGGFTHEHGPHPARCDREPTAEKYPCGHAAMVSGCGGCDPGAIEWIKDDGGPWRKVDQ